MENGPGLKMYFLLKMVKFQPAMLVHQRVPSLPFGWFQSPLCLRSSHFQPLTIPKTGRFFCRQISVAVAVAAAWQQNDSSCGG